jgi:hypothetical protein
VYAEEDLMQPAPEEPHPDPFMAELGFGAYGMGIAESITEELKERRKEILEELESLGVVEPEELVAEVPERGYKQIRRRSLMSTDPAGYHWSFDEGCPCDRCVEYSHRVSQAEQLMARVRKRADSPDSESTPNPNGGCC